MKPAVLSPIRIRNIAFGGPQPLFCIPLVGRDLAELTAEAEVASAFGPDLVEWRADYLRDSTPSTFIEAALLLRKLVTDVAVIFTLRVKREGGVQEISQPDRRTLIEAVLRSGAVDIVDLELDNEPEFLGFLMGAAREGGVRVLLAMHDFSGTPPNDVLLSKIRGMHSLGTDIAKVAVMPRTADDVLRLLQVTVEARKLYPALPLATMSMGALGSVTRVAGFLYGSDMAFAVGKAASAPGQIPMEDARRMAESLLRYS